MGKFIFLAVFASLAFGAPLSNTSDDNKSSDVKKVEKKLDKSDFFKENPSQKDNQKVKIPTH
ncbi:hypothetical protein [Campylobacter geochelonis]|uniref:Periplasmic protein n=1 Tax=Campylobacter geochelonis TaxID=1780362 RepID=A0A128EL96_9BACT|nr:hypothetical protein [Campylobacter geochelonis]QKF72070.1 hypothetical protein CGEO_1804 [Campylobacter geochelonis]CZE45844.1 Uncharacterised protein [Campylobacter geochelonis]CZE46793.1 Uncharacterised protein [Campylobacter geochelonis]CZE49841.1 Uncharacterised protein [Campylobacter geochelonis]